MPKQSSAVVDSLKAAVAAKQADVQGDADALADDVAGAPVETVDAEVMVDEPANLPATTGPASDVATGTDLEPAAREAMDRLNGWLEANRTYTADPSAAQAEIIAQVMAAESVDEVLGDTATTGLRELLDKPIRIVDGKFNRSEFEAGAPWYAVLDVIELSTGTRRTVTTGAQTILAQLVRLIQLNAFPINVVAVNAAKKPTASGYMPMRLRQVK